MTQTPAAERFESFAAFFPHYLREHAHPRTRARAHQYAACASPTSWP